MSRQDQQVGEGGEAYQAGASLTVNRGMSTDQMAELMMAMAAQLQQYMAEARETFDQRCAELRDELIEEFSKPDTEADSGALRDPDYQFVLKAAHESYGRKGGEELREELVKLLGQRSMIETGTRPALILNDAIRIAGNLTSEEYAALAMTFLIKYVSVAGLLKAQVIATFTRILDSFLPHLPSENHSYEYLAGIGCLSVNLVSGVDLWHAMNTTYGFRFGRGFEVKELEDALAGAVPIKQLSGVLIRLDGDLYWFIGPRKEEFEAALRDRGLQDDVIARLVTLVDSKLITDQDMKVELVSAIPAFNHFEEVWSKTQIKNSVLTSLGKTLAHSVVVSRIDFKGPLSIWIK